MAVNSYSLWRNSRFERNRMLDVSWFDRLGSGVTLITVISRTARCGPACRLGGRGGAGAVYQGRGRPIQIVLGPPPSSYCRPEQGLSPINRRRSQIVCLQVIHGRSEPARGEAIPYSHFYLAERTSPAVNGSDQTKTARSVCLATNGSAVRSFMGSVMAVATMRRSNGSRW